MSFLGSDERDVDFRLAKLKAADRERIGAATTRYAEIAETLRSAVGRLQKVVASGSEGMAGKSVDAIREDAEHARERLDKAAVRYEDVARETADYLVELDAVKVDVDKAEAAAVAARAGLVAAAALPDGVPDEDGALSADEEGKDLEKRARTERAEGDVASARGRLDAALEELDRAGRRLGDNVNAKRYDDGLSDTVKDKFLAVLGIIGKVLTAIAMVLAVLCIAFPGVAALVLAAVVVATASLVATSILYAHGKEGLTDLVFAVVGLATFGLGSLVSLGGKALAMAGRSMDTVVAGFGRFGARGFGRALGGGGGRPQGGAFELRAWGAAADDVAPTWRNQSDWFNNRFTNDLLGRVHPGLRPEVGLLQSSREQWRAALDMWRGFGGAKGDTLRTLVGVNGGWSGYTARMNVLRQFEAGASPLWTVWGGTSILLGVFSIGWGIGRMDDDSGIPEYGEKVMPW